MSARVVVITGASAGVGRATARAFGSRGDLVALLARGRAGLEAAAEEVTSLGGQALVLPTDVADHRQVDDAAAVVEDRLGPIDIWVNGAMTSVFAPFTAVAPEEYQRATEVTYLGTVHGTQAALRHMLQRDRGVVVQVGSALAYRGIPLQSAYCGAKHAIQGFTESLRCELLHDGSHVRVTMVQLPGLNTPQFSWVLSRLDRHPRPVAPVFQPEVAARAIMWAADHPGRREWWVGGSTVLTLLGNAVVPGLLDRYLARTGFAGQQTDDPVDPDRPDNLWGPPDDDRDAGAEGVFGAEAHPRSAQFWLSARRRWAMAATAGVVLARTLTARR